MGSVAKKGLQRLQKHPLRTKAMTEGMLSAISDIAAQKLSGTVLASCWMDKSPVCCLFRYSFVSFSKMFVACFWGIFMNLRAKSIAVTKD